MSLSTITVGSNTYSLVSIPSTPSPADIELGMNDAVSESVSPFTRQTQTQQWPGGDWWDAMITLPPLTRAQAWPWEAFLAECRGRANVFQLGDRRGATSLSGAAGTPVMSATAAAMVQSLATSGWTTFPAPGDYLQINYRLYRCANVALTGGSGANIEIFPSVREQLVGGTAITIANAKGLFRLAKNRRSIQSSLQRLTTISIACEEAR